MQSPLRRDTKRSGGKENLKVQLDLLGTLLSCNEVPKNAKDFKKLVRRKFPHMQFSKKVIKQVWERVTTKLIQFKKAKKNEGVFLKQKLCLPQEHRENEEVIVVSSDDDDDDVNDIIIEIDSDSSSNFDAPSITERLIDEKKSKNTKDDLLSNVMGKEVYKSEPFPTKKKFLKEKCVPLDNQTPTCSKSTINHKRKKKENKRNKFAQGNIQERKKNSLTKKEAEKLRRSLLFDKLIELSS